jgi:hypothetical protein
MPIPGDNIMFPKSITVLPLKWTSRLLILSTIFVLTACKSAGDEAPVATPTSPVLPPESRATSEVETDSAPVLPTPLPTPTVIAVEASPEDWLRYTNTTLGYTLQHPADLVVEETNGGTSVSFTGPLEDNEHWPAIWVSSSDTEFYRPPQGTDVGDWLIDHNFADGNFGPERQIGGFTALHTIKTRSPQSYASDDYFLIRGEHLFHIVLLHTGDRQDWELYNRFLDSISFDMSGASGPAAEPEAANSVDGWIGTLVKNPWGAQISDYFRREDGEQFGVHAYDDEALAAALDSYRWQGTTIQVWGDLITDIPDANGRQIRVTRLEALSGSTDEERLLSPFATAAASSVLPSDRLGTYHAWSAIDGDLRTTWTEGAAGSGVGEWIQLDFPGAFEVTRIMVDVGYDYSDDIFTKNNRVKRATFVFSDGTELHWDFDDVRGLQTIPMACAPGPCMETTSLKIIIDEIYPGSLYDDACIAEIEVWGIVR